MGEYKQQSLTAESPCLGEILLPTSAFSAKGAGGEDRASRFHDYVS